MIRIHEEKGKPFARNEFEKQDHRANMLSTRAHPHETRNRDHPQGHARKMVAVVQKMGRGMVKAEAAITQSVNHSSEMRRKTPTAVQTYAA